MIVSKRQKMNGHYFIHTYSDEGFYIRQDQTGIIYDEAWDRTDAEYTYTETDEKIINEEEV